MLANTTHPLAVNPSSIAFAANTTVANALGLVYTASRYTFSPPERGNIVPSSSQTNKPQKERTNPSAHRRSEAPTECTEVRIEEGVEKMPVPIMRPTLERDSLRC